jgi:hypothetical protein
VARSLLPLGKDAGGDGTIATGPLASLSSPLSLGASAGVSVEVSDEGEASPETGKFVPASLPSETEEGPSVAPPEDGDDTEGPFDWSPGGTDAGEEVSDSVVSVGARENVDRGSANGLMVSIAPGGVVDDDSAEGAAVLLLGNAGAVKSVPFRKTPSQTAYGTVYKVSNTDNES